MRFPQREPGPFTATRHQGLLPSSSPDRKLLCNSGHSLLRRSPVTSSSAAGSGPPTSSSHQQCHRIGNPMAQLVWRWFASLTDCRSGSNPCWSTRESQVRPAERQRADHKKTSNVTGREGQTRASNPLAAVVSLDAGAAMTSGVSRKLLLCNHWRYLRREHSPFTVTMVTAREGLSSDVNGVSSPQSKTAAVSDGTSRSIKLYPSAFRV